MQSDRARQKEYGWRQADGVELDCVGIKREHRARWNGNSVERGLKQVETGLKPGRNWSRAGKEADGQSTEDWEEGVAES